MTERRKLELPLNQPVDAELLFDEPITGKNQYGDYYMYALKSGEEEFTFFAPDEIHKSLLSLRKGDKVKITKVAEQKGNKLVTRFQVVTENKTPKETQPVKKSDSNLGDHYFEVMLQSYQDALKIQEQLNGMVDVNRISITLFIARSKLPFNVNGNGN